MKRYVESKAFSGFALAKGGGAYFKKVPHQLTPGHTKPSPHVDGIWMWFPPTPAELAKPAGPNWTMVPGYDICGEGDVHSIPNWPAQHSLDDLKKMVIERGWSAFVLGKPGT